MDRPVARAYDQVLLWSDLRQVIPIEANSADSAALAEQYVEAWIKQQVVLHVAEQNQSADGLAMENQLEDYRRSLVIFNYEQALVDQKLDTSVTRAQTQAYYEQNLANFELKETTVRARWFKVNEVDRRELRKLEARFLRGTSEDQHELEVWLATHGVIITDRSTGWTPVSAVLSELRPGAVGSESLLQRTGRHTISSENGAWFIEVIEQRAANTPAPLELVQTDIRAILLNQRKLQLIEDMRASVYAQAIENKHVERLAH